MVEAVVQPRPFEVERFEWRAAGGGARVVTLAGRWTAGDEPPGRAALVAERAGTLLAVAPLPSPGAGGVPLVAALSLPAQRVEDEGVTFLLKGEGCPAVRLGRPTAAELEPGGDDEAQRTGIAVRAAGEGGRNGAATKARENAAPGSPEPEAGGGRHADRDRRIRDLERDLDRERTARAALEGALEAAAETNEALTRARGEKEDLRIQLEAVESERGRLAEDLAAATRSGREWAELARTRETELTAARGEVDGTLRQLEAAIREADALRDALGTEKDAREAAEQNARAARKDRDAAIERGRAQLAGMVEAAVVRDLERELSAVRGAVERERSAREAAEAELERERAARAAAEAALSESRSVAR